MSEFPNYDVFILLKIDFTFQNSADPDEMLNIHSRFSLFAKIRSL